jgi:hypothetical protein
VEPGSATALAAGLDALLRSPDRRDALSRWGREEARRSDVTARLEDFLAVLRGDHRAQTENRP